MTQVLGSNVALHLFPSGAASLNVSADLNSVTLKHSRNNPETTTFGKTTAQRIAGIRDYSIDFAGIWNSGSIAVDVLATEMGASTNTLFRLAPASVAASPMYTGCALISDWTVTGPVGGPVAMSFTLQSAAGSLTTTGAV